MDALKGLYSEPELRQPHSAIPEIREPEMIYENYESILKKYTKPVVRKLYDWYHRLEGAYPYLGNVRMRIVDFPTKFGLFIERTKNTIRFYLRPIAQTFGAKLIGTNEELYDVSIFPEIGGKKREMLSKYRLKPPNPERVIGEEKFHTLQEREGIIDRYVNKFGWEEARKYIEGAAASISDYLFGETGIYQTWKNKFRDLTRSVGFRRAYSGAF